MSKEEFRNFVKTVEHNILIKEKLVQCKTSKVLFLVAKSVDSLSDMDNFNFDKTANQYE